MAIAFVRGNLTRDPYFKAGEQTPFAACTIKETYQDKNGETQVGGYHEVVAFGDEAQALALLTEGDALEIKASIRYRADKRFVSEKDKSKNPFAAQFVVMQIISSSHEDSEDEDPFADA